MRLIEKLPYTEQNYIQTQIQDSLNIEIDILKDEISSLLNECLSVDNSSKYLTFWESMLKVKNTNLDISARQENIKAKMRSRGTTTFKSMKNICEAYSNGEVDIIVDNSNYSFTIKFVGTLGIPKAFKELDKVINEIKPCFLAHNYAYTYMTWNAFDTYNYTWDKWDTLGLTWDEFEIYKG